jgi:hypothetical protein
MQNKKGGNSNLIDCNAIAQHKKGDNKIKLGSSYQISVHFGIAVSEKKVFNFTSKVNRKWGGGYT